ncbi:MAG: VCBS repeat-containing protein [Desulfobacterales bacterium]|nr:MAG: VCBS repeat-containing protein [Desulfobacterales bacterium]
MKILQYPKLCLLITYVAALATLAFNFAYAQTPKRIALLPFKINSDKDLSFLKDGIFDMLTTRLSKEGQVEVLGRSQVEAAMQAEAPSGTINETAARSIGSRLNADYVLFGSLTVLGNNVSIDAKMTDVAGGKPTMTFFDQSQDLGAVITKINLIAADINDKIFGRSQTQTAVQTPPPAAATPPASAESNIYAHPEKVLKEEGFINRGSDQEAELLGSRRGTARERQGQFWKSANFKHLINGICLGDVDGDGKIETVTITPNSVIIFRSNGGAFQRVAEMDAGFNKNLIAVDCADINENGKAEVFVTSLNAKRELVNSFVLEYDNTNLSKLIDDSRWYYRVASTPDRGKILLGQRPRSGNPSAGMIYEMKWQGGEYVPADPIKTPNNTNLLGLTIGNVLNEGREEAVSYKESDRIQIIDSGGQIIWNGSDRLGGSMLYYNLPRDDRGQVENKSYYPLRLVVWHNTSAKESEVIAVRNEDISNRKLDMRYFTNSQIESYKWDGVGLAPNWKTRQLSGYIQDFYVGDFDNDGQDELVAALIIKEGRIALITEPKSTIIGYELTGPVE